MKKQKTEGELNTRQKFSLICFLVGKTRRFSPAYIPLRAAYALFQSFTPFVISLLPAMIIDALIDHDNLRYVLTLTALAVLAEFAVSFFGYILQRRLDRQAYVIDQGIEMSLNETFIRMPYEKLEDPKLKDLGETARNTTNHASSLSSMVTMVFTFIGRAVSLIGLASLLARLVVTDGARASAEGAVGWLARNGGVCLIAVLALCVLSAYSNALLAKVYDRYEKRLAPVGRAYRYYGSLARQEVYAKDVRIFGLYRLIKRRIDEYSGNARRLQFQLNWYEIGVGVVGDVLMAIGIALVYAMVACKALAGAITIGEFYLYVSAVTQVIAIVKGMISTKNSIDRCLIYQSAYRKILEQADCASDGFERGAPEGEMSEIRFEHVSFTYPGGAAPVLNDVSLSLKKGERLALVGQNGAGKTTIIKLMLGLYAPSSGRILWNGQDIRDFSPEAYLRAFGAVFQDYKLIAASLKDNVAMEMTPRAIRENDATERQRIFVRRQEPRHRRTGGTSSGERHNDGLKGEPKCCGDFSTCSNEDKVRLCLERADLTEAVGALWNDIDTPLLQRFDAKGVNLSGGEAQKVAIARALYQDPSVLIMDEPTAALDPISEREFYHLIQKKTVGRTAVFISHRLSSCRLCDRILVIAEGRVTQEGSHEELASQEGLYRAMWRAQAEYYDDIAQ